MRFLRVFPAALALLHAGPPAAAAVRTAGLFGDNMVLPHGVAVPVWGWAEPGEGVAVRFAGQTQRAKTSPDGSWRVVLEPLKISDRPRTLTIAGGSSRLEYRNVLVGDVWLCSGQSNMSRPISGCVVDDAKEIAAANFPDIRLLLVPKESAAEPRRDFSASWRECSPASIDGPEGKGFSATGYFFGRELYRALKIPLGLIDASWGGTFIEAWTPREGFAAFPELAGEAERVLADAPAHRSRVLYNGMIEPLTPFAIRGIIWYQGESNVNTADSAKKYARRMKALVASWREKFGRDDLPFYFVQLAPFAGYGGPGRLSEIRSGQAMAAREIAHAGMAVATDNPDDVNDIHPRNKQEIGDRLARLALKNTYGQSIVADGPQVEKIAETPDGFRVSFTNLAGGLRAKGGGELTGFSIAGADGVFRPARAEIDGASVRVWRKDAKPPRTLHYAWENQRVGNLVNGAGLPAAPF